MGVLNLRDVPDELMRELRAQAALKGEKFHPFCIALLKEAVTHRRMQQPGWRPVGFEDQVHDFARIILSEPDLPPGATGRAMFTTAPQTSEPQEPPQEIEIT